MLRLTERVEASEAEISGVLVQPFAVRQKSRFRAVLLDGNDVGVFLERGRVLRDGDLLRATNGRVIRVEAAPETVSTVYCHHRQRLARLCYHLGNRHVMLQIGADFARYQHDHVLDDMVRSLGLKPVTERAPFEPEAGAYHHHHSHAGPSASPPSTDHGLVAGH